jgi:hypothetical protein
MPSYKKNTVDAIMATDTIQNVTPTRSPSAKKCIVFPQFRFLIFLSILYQQYLSFIAAAFMHLCEKRTPMTSFWTVPLNATVS